MITTFLHLFRDMSGLEVVFTLGWLILILLFLCLVAYANVPGRYLGRVIGRWLKQGWTRIFCQVRSDLRTALALPAPSSKVTLIADYRRKAVRR